MALFPPVYLIVRGMRLRKLYRLGVLRAYAPLGLLLVMVVAYAYTARLYFGADAVALANG